MTLDKNELKYRAGLNAVDQHIGKLKIVIPLAILGWPIVMSAGGVGAVIGLGVIGIGAIATAYKNAWDDWQKIDNDDRPTLSKLTPKKHRRDLHQAYAVIETSEAPLPNPPPILKKRPNSHLLLMGPTQSGKTAALRGLIPSETDALYISLKPDKIPTNWTGYRIDLTRATADVNAVLNIVEPLIGAMLRGERSGSFWLIVDEIIGICELCDKATAQRLLSLVKVIVTGGAAMGCFIGLLMQSPNATDLGISAALMRNFQAVVLASERSEFEHFAEWSERFCPLSPGIKQQISSLNAGFWVVSGGKLYKPAASLAKTKTCIPVGLASTPTTSTTPAAPLSPNPRNTEVSTPTTPATPHKTTPTTPTSSTAAESCPKCESDEIVVHSATTAGTPRRRCKACGKVWSLESTPNPTPPPINVWGV